MDIFSVLTKLGLTRKEVAVYIATLELGIAPVSQIATKAKLKRPSVHEIVKQLCNKGLLERFIKKSIRHFSAISPRMLHEKLSQNMTNFERMLPQLIAVDNGPKNKPQVTFYEGKEELEKLYLDVLECKEKIILNYFLPDKNIAYFTKDWLNKNHISVRKKRGIQLRVIMPESKWTAYYMARKDELRDIRIIKDKKLTIGNETYIYDDKISIFSFEGEFALLIQDKNVVDSQRTMFELAWNSSLVNAA